MEGAPRVLHILLYKPAKCDGNRLLEREKPADIFPFPKGSGTDIYQTKKEAMG